jgi:ribonuclease P protein component
MIGRTNRFHGRAGIQRLRQNGNVVRSGMMALRYAPCGPKRSTYRMAVVVSRKVSKSAVIRNRIRRRLYERVRILSGSFDRPYDLTLMVYDAQLAVMPADQLDNDVRKMFALAKLTSAEPPQRAIVEPREK